MDAVYLVLHNLQPVDSSLTDSPRPIYPWRIEEYFFNVVENRFVQ